MVKTAVILTVFNRRDVTLKGLRSLYTAIDYLQKDQQKEGFLFDVYMTDDGSTDGTTDAVQDEFPEVHIIQGDGNLYWNGGMLKAWHAAINSINDYDFFLWFNDDAYLYEDALKEMFRSYEISGERAIISGAFCDKESKVSYGGWNNNTLVKPNGDVQDVELINGNLVLVPKVVYNQIGILDSHFIHSFGDWEYGIRARKHGSKVVISSGYVGKCERHDGLRKSFDPKYGILERLKNLYTPTGLYPPSLFYYFRKCYGCSVAIRKWLYVHLKCVFTQL